MSLIKTVSERPEVFLEKCGSYTAEEISPKVCRILDSVVDPLGLGGKTILLKPNLISSQAPSLACTSGEIITQTARYFIDRGAQVKIGDSPAFGTTRSVLENHGVDERLRSLPVRFVSFSTPVQRQLPDGRHVQIAAEALECDLLVNLPRLKAHNQLYFTCAVKNFFGTVVGLRKAMLHMSQGKNHQMFASLLLSLPNLFPHHLSLVDAIDVMHKSGPMDGERLHLGCLAGSICPVALDTTLMHILELEVSKSPVLQVAKEEGYPGANVDNCSFPLRKVGDFPQIDFIGPEALNPIRFNPFRLMMSAVKRISLAKKKEI